MAAVMVVGGAVMAFADDSLADDSLNEFSDAEIVFELDLDNFVREPEPEDFPPDWNPDDDDLLNGLQSMDLHFGTRDILYLNTGRILSTLDTIDTRDPDNRELNNALVVNPPDDSRVMGVTFQSGVLGAGFTIQVHRDAFNNLEGDTVGGVVFSLVGFGTPIRLLGNADVTVTDRVINSSAQTVITGTNFGKHIAGFSGELTSVGQDQVSALAAQATLYWTLVPGGL
jgi:hypothetical protein